MDDLRQKLFPIFLGEAERNLAALRQFLEYEDLSTASAEALETAFRAAHTLKGTANLVKADSICKIARRLEALLEKHFEAGSKPTRVEHEAMRLAVDWLAPLISALQGDLQEPKLFVEEALQALDLAEAFPGRTPLVELLDSRAERRAPQLDDPFAGDPELLTEAGEPLQAKADPFGEDPSFGMEIELGGSSKGASPVVPNLDTEAGDPFAEDHEFDSEDVALEELSSAPSGPVEELPFDPFAEDDLEFGVEPAAEVTETVTEEAARDSLAEDMDFGAEADAPEAELGADPFADDEAFGAETDLDAETDEEEVAEEEVAEEEVAEEEVAEEEQEQQDADPFAPATDVVAARAGEIAESLLLPQDETAPRKDYVCCVFSIGGRDYHLPIKQMQEIADLQTILPLPLAPPMVSGLINLRGQVMPVINLATLNQHQQAEVRVQRRLVVAEYQGESLAFLADGIPYLAEEFSGEKIDMAKFLSLYRIIGAES